MMRQIYPLLLCFLLLPFYASTLYGNNENPPCTATILTQSQEVCNEIFPVAAADPESGETGMWTGPTGTAFVDASNPMTFITALLPGDNTLTWSIFDASGLCSTASIVLTNNEVQTTPVITTPNNVEVCDENNFQLAANQVLLAGEIGTWSSNNNMVTFAPSNNDPNAIANNLQPGNNIILWTIRKGGCSAQPASITVTNNEVITNPEIEPNSTLESCVTDGFFGIFANINNQLIPGETGTWSGPPGVTFSPVNSESPTVSGLQPGSNILTWTISRGNCPTKSISVNITNNEVQTNADVLTSSQEVCDESNFSIEGNIPEPGETGTWTGPTGVSFSDINDPNSTVDGLLAGDNEICWTISRGNCPPTQDCVIITNNEVITISTIVTADGQEVCDENGFTVEANTPLPGETGTWSGPQGVTFSPDANSANATVDNLPLGTSTLCWTITRGNCPSTQACIDVTNNEVTTVAAIATADGQEVCDENGFALSANTVLPEETGTWSGPAGVTFDPNANDPNAVANNLPLGTSTLCWTVTRGNCVNTSTVACIDVTNNEVTTVAAVATADNQEVCDENNFSVEANTPLPEETGTWSGPPGVTFSPSPNDPSATVDNLPPGTSTLCWTVTRGGCVNTSTVDCIDVINNEVTTVSAIATADGQEICDENNFVLEGNLPTGSQVGTWTGPTGATFTPGPNSPTVTVDNLPTGTSTFTWTITNGNCPSTDASVTVTNNEVTTVAAIATATGQEVCDDDTFVVEGNAPTGNEMGTWTGPAGVTFDPNANSPTATVIDLPEGTNTLTWTISNGNCPPSSANVTVTNNEPTLPEISTMTGQSICDIESFTLMGNTPLADETGMWTGPAGVSYDPGPNSPTVTVDNLPPGSNDFIWTIGQGNCSLSDTVTVITFDTPEGTATVTDVSTVGGNDGLIEICVNGGTSPYDITWAPNTGTLTPVAGPCDANYELSGLTMGVYDIFILDANGCTDTIPNVAVSDPDCADFNIGLVTTVNETCNESDDASITIEVLNGQGEITYSIGNGISDVITMTNPYTFENLPAGSYNLFVQDERLCANSYISNPVIITEPDPLAVSTSVFDVTTIGGTDGEVCITVTGGTAPYTVTADCGTVLTGSGPSCGGDFYVTGLPETTCNITVVDATGECTVMTSATVNPPACDLSVDAINISEVNCYNGSDGAITITASSSNGAISYSIDNGATFMTGASPFTFDNLPSGSYDIVLQDAVNCEFVYSNNPVVLDNPVELTVASTQTPTTTVGGNDGIIDICVDGGTPAYSVSYSPNTGFLTTVAGSCDQNYQILGLIEGTYTVTVTDANGCEETFMIDVEGPDCSAFTIGQVTTTNEDCNDTENGSITIEVLGAVGEITYSVGNGIPDVVTNATPYTFDNLSEGSYVVAVIDERGCTNSYISNPVLITAPDPLSVQTTVTDASTLGGSDGQIEVCVNGGTAPYTATIDPVAGTINNLGSTTCDGNFDITGLPAGQYVVTVEDANGCIITTTQIVNDPSCVLSVDNVTTTSALCNGDSNGSLTVTASGDNPPFEYSIDGGMTFQPANTFSGLPAGSYDVVLADAVGCTNSYSGNPAIITQPDPLVVVVDSFDVSTLGGSDGRLLICINGGTMPYNVSIAPNLGTITQVMGTCDANFEITGLPDSTYVVTIEDMNGCTDQFNVTIEEPDCSGFMVTTVVPTDNSCNVSEQSNPVPDGTIEIFVTGGVPPYDYSIFGGANPSTFTDTSFLFTGLNVGSYTVAVTDASGCTVGYVSNPIIIDEPVLLTAPPTLVNPSVIGGSDGEICITPMGGIPPYTVTATCGTVIAGPGPQCGGDFHIAGLMAGSCNILVVDANGCEASGTVTLMDPECDEFGIIAVDATDPNCNGADDGTITITATGIPPYQFSIDGGVTLVQSIDSVYTFTDLPPGSYTVYIEDMVLCMETFGTTIVLTEPVAVLAVDLTAVTQTCIGESQGEIDLTVSGGTPPYTFDWSNGETTEDLTGLADGTYSVTVTDANGCAAAQDNISLSTFDDATVDAGEDVEIEIGSSTTLTATVGSGANGTFEWTPTTGLSNPNSAITDAEPTETTTYTVTFVSEDGCIATDEVTITAVDPSVVVVPGGFTPGGNGPSENDYFYPVIDGPVEILSLTVWNRWGEKVYDNPNPPGWDGTYKGAKQPLATFVYVLEYRINGGDKEVLKGDFVLIR